MILREWRRVLKTWYVIFTDRNDAVDTAAKEKLLQRYRLNMARRLHSHIAQLGYRCSIGSRRSVKEIQTPALISLGL